MPIQLKNSTFLHLPKTGGVWVERALIKYAKVLKCNDSIHDGHIMPDIDKNIGCFAFVRHPVDWIFSLYHQRKRKNWNWQKYLELENLCKADNLKDFYLNISKQPGIIKRYFDHYIHKYEYKTNFIIGKTENLCLDLLKILDHFNEEYNILKIIEFNNNKQNELKGRGIDIEKLPDFSYDIIYSSQQDFYLKYDYGIKPKYCTDNDLFYFLMRYKLRIPHNGTG